MTDTILLLVAERNDESRDDLVGQPLADGYQVRAARIARLHRHLFAYLGGLKQGRGDG